MAGMEIDSSPEHSALLAPRDRIVQRLARHGVSEALLDQSPWCLVAVVRDKKSLIPEIVNNILPTDADVLEVRRLSKKESGGGAKSVHMKELFGESMSWLQWLMFEGEPQLLLQSLAQGSAGQRAVCGSVWGHNDLAYRCRTCEHDPTCAICVPCFQNGNHKNHDYSIMYTGGGCCDCGDETAWKREGFCSKHKGAEQIQPLPEDLANSVGPVLDVLLACWKDKVVAAQARRQVREGDRNDVQGKSANELTSAVVEMLLDFCNYSESLLSFISRRMFECSGLLDALVRAERFLDKVVVKKLHELLLKLLGEPLFKYEFAKIFTKYYPFTVNEIIKESSDSTLEKYPLLSTFSVQIFTVPTLTPRLVQEVDLLGVLLGCLKDLFLSCVAEDNRLQASKWANIYETTIRLIEDTRYVLSHNEVPIYIARERPDISRTWLNLLSLVQGMDAQKRLTGLHTEEENDNLPGPFVLGHYLGNVHTLLVGGAFSVDESKESKDGTLFSDIQSLDDGEIQRHAKVGRLSQESSACTISGRTGGQDFGSRSIPSPVVWLILECLKAIDSWLGSDTTSRSGLYSFDASSSSASNILNFRKRLSRIRRGTNSNRVSRRSTARVDMDGDQVPGEHHESVRSFPSIHGMLGCLETERRETLCLNNDPMDVNEDNHMYSENACTSAVSDDGLLEMDSGAELEAFSILNSAGWPDIDHDVSSQEISFHIPLHRLLSLLLRKTLKNCYGETGNPPKLYGISGLSPYGPHGFFQQVLGGLHPNGFSAYVMEHPLRLRVFCAQVRAGMWRKNGDAAVYSSEWYRSVQWLEQGIESDLFLLQCCAALSPPELFVERIQERFGLFNYTSLNLAGYNEYEPVLVQEMLTLIIQIVKERRFCGSSTSENLRRELVYKLAVGDATHSQLVKALPRDLSKNDQLQNVLDMLAVYSKPSGMKQGKYSLRKEFWKELDLYHPRWNSRDLQVAEERYFRYCKVSALNAQLPQWTEVFDPLTSISKIATSKAVLLIVRAVIFYAVFTEMSSVSRAPDGVLITALHLLSLALDICDTHSQIYGGKVGGTVDLSHCDGQSEDLLPILSYASEEFDAGSTGDVFWKNQSMLSLLVSLMRKYKEDNGNHYAERRQCNISSLTENLLKKLARLSPKCMGNLEQLAPDVVCHMLQRSTGKAVHNPASISDMDGRRAKARQRQAAIMEKMRAEQSKFIASLTSAATEESDNSKPEQEISIPEVDDAQDESVPVCSLCRDTDSGSPLCFLILLQKSRIKTFVERGPPSWEEVDESGKEVHSAGNEGVIHPSADSSSPAQLLGNAGLEFDYDTETAEVNPFQDFLNQQLPDIRNIQLPNLPYDTCTTSASPFERMEVEIYEIVRGGIHGLSHSAVLGDEQCSTSNILSVKKSRDAESFLIVDYVSSLSGESLKQDNSSIHGLLNLANISTGSTTTTAKLSGFGPRDCDGIHISSCGHAVHQDCHDRYLASLKQRHNRRLGFEGGHIVDPDLGELLCPVCRRFANSILPAFSGVNDKAWRQMTPSVGVPSSVVSCTSTAMDNNNLLLPLALSLLQCTAKTVAQGRYQKVFSGKQTVSVEPSLEPALRKLCLLFYSNSYDNLSTSGRLSPSLPLWDTLRYSLISAEIAARGRVMASSTGSISSTEALFGELHSSSGFILSLLFHGAQTTRSLNRHDVHLRFRGIQLLAESLCSGFSGDDKFSSSDKGRGIFLSILEYAGKGEAFPDFQFCKQVADPILAHDPFSSFMWVLFCLPYPFVSSWECFVPFVHLFYVVCVVQGLITCHSKHYFDVSCFGNCLVNNICKMMGETELVREYFVSNYIDSSCHPKDMIRRLTFPYLRRCALLWKLLQSSAMSPLYGSFNTWEGSNIYTNDNSSDTANGLSEEFIGIKELEDMFQINSLESVLKDEFVNHLALKWCVHFCEEFSVRKCGANLYSTPAVPFRLMQLPRLYQDLLQRYVKQRCSDCKSVPDEPALCLLCGKLCSPSWKSCCRASRCLNHAMVCGAGISVFLLVRRTTILLQRSSRQAIWPSPYLDAFGEEDHDMYRGKPLYLSEERYAALTYLVASHGLDRTSEVLRQTSIGLFGAD